MCQELQLAMQRSLEEACMHEELQHKKKTRKWKKNAHEEMKCMTQEEMQLNTYHQVESENQVSEFLCCFLKMLSHPKATNKLTHVFKICMEEGETTIALFSTLI